MRRGLALLGALVAGAGAGLAVAEWRWRSGTAALVSRLRANAAVEPAAAPTELEALPAPVARYFRAVLPSAGAAIRTARLQQRGEFLARPGPDGWRPFTAWNTSRRGRRGSSGTLASGWRPAWRSACATAW